MKEDFWGIKEKKTLKVNIKDSTKELVTGAISLALAIPLVIGISEIFGGNN